MNADVVYREKDIENYNKGIINYECDENGTYKIKDNAEFYKVDNRVRKVWEVKIFYDYYNEYYKKDMFIMLMQQQEKLLVEIAGVDQLNK